MGSELPVFFYDNSYTQGYGLTYKPFFDPDRFGDGYCENLDFVYEVIKDDDPSPIPINLILEHLRLDTDQVESNSYITLLVKTAIKIAERATKREITNKTIRIHANNFRQFSHNPIRLCPLKGISTFNYFDGTGTEQVFTNTNYSLGRIPGPYQVIRYIQGVSFPALDVNNPNPVYIDVMVGGFLPDDMKLAIMHHVSVMYEQRGDWGAADLGLSQLIGAIPSLCTLTYGSYRITNR